MSRKFIFLWCAAAGLLVAVAFWFRVRDGQVAAGGPSSAVSPEAPFNIPRREAPRLPRAQVATIPEVTTTQNGPPPSEQLRLSREVIEQHLASKHRTPESLLAAFRASGDTNYLTEAASLAPDNPRVQLAVLSAGLFPAERRAWLERFKSTAPDNSLASYLSAQDYFKANQRDAALKELVEATRKPQFRDYSMDTLLDLEELHRNGSSSPLEVETGAMAGMAADHLPRLAQLKSVSVAITELKDQYSSAGDAHSMQSLAQMGLALAGRLNSGESSKFLIDQLVGMAIENQALRNLPVDVPLDFLGGQTAGQRSEALKTKRADLRTLVNANQGAIIQASPPEQQAYFDRLRVYGESEAMRWFQSQLKARNATQNP